MVRVSVPGMADDWSFGEDDEAPAVRQPLRIRVEDSQAGEQVTLELTAQLRLDAGTLLTVLGTVGDGEAQRLVRALRILEAALVDDDGIPVTWEPEQVDGKWKANDSTLHSTAAGAAPGLAQCSSRRKLNTVVDQPRWRARLDVLEAAAIRIQEAAAGRPTATATSSPRGRGSAARRSAAGSDSPRRP